MILPLREIEGGGERERERERDRKQRERDRESEAHVLNSDCRSRQRNNSGCIQ